MKCRAKDCPRKAEVMVVAFGGNGWSGVYCPRHAGRVIRLRWRLIKRGPQHVTVRPLTKWDIKKIKERV